MPSYQSTYTTVEKVVAQLPSATSATLSSSSADYTAIYNYCKQASAYIEQKTGRVFAPFTETREYYFRDVIENGMMRFNRGRCTLYLDADLLVTSSLTWDGTAVSATYFRERTSTSSNNLPFTSIDFDTVNGNLTWSNDFADYVAIAGVWGYHENLGQAFVATSQTMTINSSATSVAVSDGTAFDVLSYIRVESELMQVTAKSGNTLTLSRGVNGYTASAHTSATIERYFPIEAIALCATRIASYLYQNRNNLNSIIQFNDGTTVVQGVEGFIMDIMRYVKPMRPVLI